MKQLPFLLCFTIMCLLCIVTVAQRNEIPNGDFENWPDDFAPEGFGSFQAPQKQYAQLRTVFKSNDAKSGKSSVRLRNTSIKEYVAAMNINTYGMSFPDQSIPAGIWSCDGNCKIPPRGNIDRVKFPVTKRYKTLCGYYKGTLAGGDKLFVSIVMFKGNNVMGGSDAGTIQHAFVTQSSNGWKKFEIPITYLNVRDDAVPDGAALQISIVGAGYPQNAYAGGTGQSVHLGTELFIDDVAFCVGKADVLVFSPKVLNEVNTTIATEGQDSTSTMPEQNESTGTNVQIPQNENLDPGVQTFVNLDNDDRDKYFDFNPEDEPASDKEIKGGDDELVKIILRIPERTILEAKSARKQMTAKLEITKGPGHIRIYEKDTKAGRITVPKIFDVYTDFTERLGEYLIKEIWIEGILAHSTPQGTLLKFTHSEDLNFKDEFAITIIGIEKIEWLGKENSYKDDDVLDTDPNHMNPDSSRLLPEAQRVFPGQRMKGNGLTPPRNTVNVAVTLSVKPVRPVKIYFESYDVDDPGAAGNGTPIETDVDNEAWIDDEDKTGDNRGNVGTGGIIQAAGRFRGENNGILEVEFDKKTDTFEFEVTMQPGDNFRIVGSPDQDFLRSLYNDDKELNKGGSPKEKNENKQRLVDRFVLKANPDRVKEAEVRDKDKYASKTLTVWRFFYAEMDHMMPIEGNSVSGAIVDIKHIAENKSELYLDKNIRTQLGYRSSEGVANSFNKGRLTINGSGRYLITGNTANHSEKDYITVDAVVPVRFIGMTYEIFDDDEKHPVNLSGWEFKNGAQLWDPNVTYADGVNSRFARAYIVPDFKTLNTATLNPNNRPPFVLNSKSYADVDLLSCYSFENIATEASEDFWTVYILGAFQGVPWEDGDPDGEQMISGIIDSKKIGAHIYLEGSVEKSGGLYKEATVKGIGEQDVVVHELSHLFGTRHEDMGLLEFPDPKDRLFSKRSLARIRECKHP